MMITIRILSYGEVTGEKFFKDHDNVEALEWAESQVTMFEGEAVEMWWKGNMLWSSETKTS